MNESVSKRIKRVGSTRRSRGAALVEAAVVIPMMLVFLGCIMFVDGAYEAKLDKQMSTRAGALHYASHNCDGAAMAAAGVGAAGNGSADVGAQLPSSGADPSHLGASGDGNREGAATAIDNSWNLSKASVETSVDGNASLNGKRVLMNTSVRAKSQVACNEKPFPNKWKAVIDYVGHFVSTGGGL